MTSKSVIIPQSSWQRSRWMQALVLLLFIVLTYAAPIVTHINRDRPYVLNEVIFYTGVVGSLAVAALLFILRFFYGERFGDLNLKRGRWWQNVLAGIALTALTLGTLYLLGPVIERVLPRAPNSGLGDIFYGLDQDPWLLALFVGPILAISVAGWEEISRVFLLSRWWKIASGTAWRWLGVLVSAALFGLAHFYQGPSGMANAAITGLILAVVYLRFGRVWPLIICHYLQDALQIVLFVYLIRSGVI